LTEGLVITVEPFLSTGAKRVITDPNGWTLKTPDGSLSAQYEHTIVVTRGQPIIVTAL
jgi:methionyl aminopeptidase